MRVAVAAGALVVLFMAVPPTAPSAGATQPPTEVIVHACEVDAPDGWVVLEEASGASELNVLCNFLVTRFLEDIQQEMVSGIAITIEFFCTSAEAQAAFVGKTGKRDTETSRSSTKVVTEEGPAAKNKDNPQSDRSIFGFGPVPYDLQEKAWEMLSPQIVATIVVLTNERGAASEEDRFGITMAEPAAVVIANNHLPTACKVPAIGAAPGTKGAKGGPGRILVTVGVGGAIAIGGVTIWRRRKNRPLARPPSGITNVPPDCVKHSTEFEQSREVLQTLREAFQDLSEELHTAQKNQSNNIIKTKMIMGFEAGQLIGSTIGDLTQVLRPRVAHVGRTQSDSWKPPGGLDAKMAAAFRSAMELLERARGRVGDLRNKLASLTASLSNLANHQVVRQAQERAAAALNALHRGEQALVSSSSARSLIDGLDGSIGQVGAAASANFKLVEGLENNIAKFRGFIAQAEDEIVTLTRTVDGANPTAAPAVSSVLTNKQSSLESMRRQLQRDLTELAPLKTNHRDTLRNLDVLMARREEALRELAKHGDVSPRDVDKLREVHHKLVADAAAAQGLALGDLSGQYEAARAALAKAEIEQGLADAYLKGLRAQLERGGAAATPNVSRRVLHGATTVLTLPLVPLIWLWEKGFGSVQSVPEAFEIVMRGERRITEMTRNVTRIERAVDQLTKRTELLRRPLQKCIDDAARAAKTSAP